VVELGVERLAEGPHLVVDPEVLVHVLGVDLEDEDLDGQPLAAGVPVRPGALGEHRIDRFAQFAFGLNALRLLLRQWDVYAFPPASFDALYDALYLPLVVLTFAPIALWLLLRNNPNDAPASGLEPFARS